MLKVAGRPTAARMTKFRKVVKINYVPTKHYLFFITKVLQTCKKRNTHDTVRNPKRKANNCYHPYKCVAKERNPKE